MCKSQCVLNILAWRRTKLREYLFEIIHYGCFCKNWCAMGYSRLEFFPQMVTPTKEYWFQIMEVVAGFPSCFLPCFLRLPSAHNCRIFGCLFEFCCSASRLRIQTRTEGWEKNFFCQLFRPLEGNLRYLTLIWLMLYSLSCTTKL